MKIRTSVRDMRRSLRSARGFLRAPARLFATVRVFALVAAVAALIAFAACSDDNEITRAVDTDARDDGPATLAKNIENNNTFAVKLYAKLKGSDDNIIVSPHSIATCFGMAYAGARGNTEREIADVLCFNYPPAGFHSVLEQLNDELTSRADVDLRIANACWGRDGLPCMQAYLDTLSGCYGAPMEYLDFAGDPEGARAIVNEWVENNTAGFIKDLFPPYSFDANTYLVLANTVYFIADWLHQFDPIYTHPGSFTRLDGSQVAASYMQGEASMPYFEGDGFQAMAMPYKGEQVSMVLIMPDAGGFGEFENAFSAAGLDTIVDRLSAKVGITFTIPKFGFFSGYDLVQTLQEMGMVDAFAPGAADFSGMDGTADGVPWIDLVVHKAYITIDEYGTMAFAGTGMSLTLGVHPSFVATRPFIFIILDNPTGTVLFMGRVLDPSAA
jgi:serpin B